MFKIPEELKLKVLSEELVVFVGTGLSVSVGLPNWNSLIKEILEPISAGNTKLTNYIEILDKELFEPLEVLNKVENLKETLIVELDKAIRKYDSCEPSSVHRKLGNLSNQIITTNYDGLIEKALPHYEKVIYSNEYKVAKLSDYEKYIFKIHGDIEEPHKCILFKSQYEELYNAKEKPSIFELKKIISDKSILFIGFGLKDPYVNFVFDYISNLYSGFNPKHFIITSKENQTFPNNIVPIPIENYQNVGDLLTELIKIKTNRKEAEIQFKNDYENQTDSKIIQHKSNSGADSPPQNKYWVGRTREISNIANENFKVIFITGIGGQGKSALAAHFIRNHFDSINYEFADWRDFKEEANRFQTKLISIIQRLDNSFDISKIENLNSKELIKVFFQKLQLRRIIFVFDNMDNYIDLEAFKPAGILGFFLDQILKREHSSKFIFTCRPLIREASVDFYQIRLTGISEDESLVLFKNYNISASKSQLLELSLKAHEVTKGHPLWLNLIAGQAIRGIDTASEFLRNVENKSTFNEENLSSILSEKILDQVWNSLNEKQKNLIRGISETVKPESENNLRTILMDELKPNQFNKSLKTLKNLNLVEVLADGEIELHPLVKEFVLTKYPKNERSKFITLFVRYYDKFIYILKPNLSSQLTLKNFENWTSKIELQINNNEFKNALTALEEVSSSMISAGYSEEYIRVTDKLYSNIDWERAITDEFPYFHSQFNEYCTIQTQLGLHKDVENCLKKYVVLISGKSSHYISYCSLRTYNLWYQNYFKKAIDVGEEAEILLNESDIADNHNLRHNLALARRDSKNEENVKKALFYFLKSEKLEEVTSNKGINFELSGSFYGNVGRCLEFSNRLEDALICYYKSFKSLTKEDDSSSLINLGYASFWIGQLLVKMKDKTGLYFLTYSKNLWLKTSPPRMEEARLSISKSQFENEYKKKISNLSEWKIKRYCENCVNEKDFISH
ncbi:MAG: SIR2 family protein [Bacteroidota bacterium]